jgi:hypothetical protein
MILEERLSLRLERVGYCSNRHFWWRLASTALSKQGLEATFENFGSDIYF